MTNNFISYQANIKAVNLELGTDYLVWTVETNKKRVVRLIKPTKKGYNLLNIATSKCMLKYHMYPSKYDVHTRNGETWFFVNKHLNFQPIKPL